MLKRVSGTCGLLLMLLSVAIVVSGLPVRRVKACLSRIFVSGETMTSAVPLDEELVKCKLKPTPNGSLFLSSPRYIRTPLNTTEVREAITVSIQGNRYKYRWIESERVVWKLLEY